MPFRLRVDEFRIYYDLDEAEQKVVNYSVIRKTDAEAWLARAVPARRRHAAERGTARIGLDPSSKETGQTRLNRSKYQLLTIHVLYYPNAAGHLCDVQEKPLAGDHHIQWSDTGEDHLAGAFKGCYAKRFANRLTFHWIEPD